MISYLDFPYMVVAAIAGLFRRRFASRTVLLTGALALGMCVIDAPRADEPVPEPVQLQLRGSSRLADWISTAGFPALSESGEQLAILLGSSPPSDEFAVLEIRAVTSGNLLERYELVEESDPLRLDPSTRDQLAAKIAAALDVPNRRLRDGNFQAMQLKLFDRGIETDIQKSWSRGYWESERSGLRIRLEHGETTTLSVEDDKHRLHVSWPPKDLGRPRETGDPQNCFSYGVPSRAWLHPGREFVLVEVERPGNHHSSCDEATEWQFEKLLPIGTANNE